MDGKTVIPATLDGKNVQGYSDQTAVYLDNKYHIQLILLCTTYVRPFSDNRYVRTIQY